MAHRSARPSHYDEEAKSYDAFNETKSRVINRTIESILRKHGVRTVLDLACGTGSQVFWLARRGFDVAGADFNAAMLKIARRKSKSAGLGVRLLRGDMRRIRVGRFDAAITISNAVGHLTRSDFARTLRNLRRNLFPGGLYFFDIFNERYLRRGNNIERLTIDWRATIGRSKVREQQYSTIDADGVLTSCTTMTVGKRVTRDVQTLQVYSAPEVAALLRDNGFVVVSRCGVDGSPFSELHTDRMLIVARC